MVVDIELDLFGSLERIAEGTEAVRFAAIDRNIRLRRGGRHFADPVHPFQKGKLLRDRAFADDAAPHADGMQHAAKPHPCAQCVAVRPHMAEYDGAFQLFQPSGDLF